MAQIYWLYLIAHRLKLGIVCSLISNMVSDQFEGKRPVARHQMVYKLLADELSGDVHALALHLFTASEWEQAGNSSLASPNCKGAGR